jgi:cAMP phosphodiesterase
MATKYILASNFTITTLINNVFNWQVWPNFGSVGAALK